MNSTLTESKAQEQEEIDEVSSSVLLALLYYDLFTYPLTIDEILAHCRKLNCSKGLVEKSIQSLVEKEFVFCFHEFYSLRSDRQVFLKRIRGNEAAIKAFPKAIRRSRLIAKFPFVQCVCISGSFSKKYFDEKTDLDFFIITKPNRLWLCRTLLILYKKFFLLNSKKFFCINYFIDSDSFEIPDQNIFTATEVNTLLPMVNYDLYMSFFMANEWVKKFFPNTQPRRNEITTTSSASFIKGLLEFLLQGNFGEWLDKIFLRLTLNHWKKKFNWLPSKEFEVNMRSRRNVSKHHPQGFQFQVLKRYEERIRSFELQHEITLD